MMVVVFPTVSKSKIMILFNKKESFAQLEETEFMIKKSSGIEIRTLRTRRDKKIFLVDEVLIVKWVNMDQQTLMQVN